MMRVRPFFVNSYNEFPFSEEGFEMFGKKLDAEIRRIEKVTKSTAIAVHPTGNIEMRKTGSSGFELGSYVVRGIVILKSRYK